MGTFNCHKIIASPTPMGAKTGLKISSLQLALLLLVISQCSMSVRVAEIKNIQGQPLQACSTGDMATTGWYRTGKCQVDSSDHGSHHVCLDILGLDKETNKSFCGWTGQPEWCREKQNGKTR